MEQLKQLLPTSWAAIGLGSILVGAWVSVSAGFMPPFMVDTAVQQNVFSGLLGAFFTALKVGGKQ